MTNMQLLDRLEKNIKLLKKVREARIELHNRIQARKAFLRGEIK